MTTHGTALALHYFIQFFSFRGLFTDVHTTLKQSICHSASSRRSKVLDWNSIIINIEKKTKPNAQSFRFVEFRRSTCIPPIQKHQNIWVDRRHFSTVACAAEWCRHHVVHGSVFSIWFGSIRTNGRNILLFGGLAQRFLNCFHIFRCSQTLPATLMHTQLAERRADSSDWSTEAFYYHLNFYAKYS